MTHVAATCNRYSQSATEMETREGSLPSKDYLRAVHSHGPSLHGLTHIPLTPAAEEQWNNSAMSFSARKCASPRRVYLCNESHCQKRDAGGGFCVKHGGGRRCEVQGCSRVIQGKGRKCKSHGGGTKCSVESCVKKSVGRGFCYEHGGGKRCRVEGCNEPAIRSKLYCTQHLSRDFSSAVRQVSRKGSAADVMENRVAEGLESKRRRPISQGGESKRVKRDNREKSIVASFDELVCFYANSCRKAISVTSHSEHSTAQQLEAEDESECFSMYSTLLKLRKAVVVSSNEILEKLNKHLLTLSQTIDRKQTAIEATMKRRMKAIASSNEQGGGNEGREDENREPVSISDDSLLKCLPSMSQLSQLSQQVALSLEKSMEDVIECSVADEEDTIGISKLFCETPKYLKPYTPESSGILTIVQQLEQEQRENREKAERREGECGEEDSFLKEESKKARSEHRREEVLKQLSAISENILIA